MYERAFVDVWVHQSNKFNQNTAQRFLLSPGDHFFVPVNNIYRLENHSDSATAVIYWTIVKVGLIAAWTTKD